MKKLFLLLMLFPILIFGETKNTYKICSDEDVYYSTFSTSKTDSQILYIYNHETEKQINYYNQNGITQKFTYEDSLNKINYSAVLEGKKIILKGNSGDKNIDKIIKIDDDPWKQSMSYSLSEFALGNEEKIKFWIIRLDKLKGAKIQAERVKTEDILIGDKQYNAVNVKISTHDLLSNIWHCNYWFRSSDGLFLKYEGLNGLPGAGKTIIELFEKE